MNKPSVWSKTMALVGWRWAGAPMLPAAARQAGLAQRADRLFWSWLAMVGVALFAAWWLHQRGVWVEMMRGDPSGISAGIVALSVVVTAWCGRRAWVLAGEAKGGADTGTVGGPNWRTVYRSDHAHDAASALQRLAERTHGAHETAWWFASATIKLGLLGTVVGFIAMSMQIGRMPNFDFDQVQVLLKRMTEGMAIALYTTLAGLIANLWLGLQLMLLDRQADALAADILADTPAGPSWAGAAVKPGTAPTTTELH